MIHTTNHNPGLEPPTLATREQRLRVLIADHDGLARSMIRTALAEDPRIAITFTAEETNETTRLANYYHPEIVIIDTNLPPHGCLQPITTILQTTPHAKIITTSINDHQTAIAALRAGATGHIDKSTDPTHLPDLITRAASGQPIIPPQLTTHLLTLIRETPTTGWRPLHSRLTTREWEIIDHLTQGHSTQQIADQLVLSTTTIYTHIRNLNRKLHVHTRTQAITAAAELRKQETLNGSSQNYGDT